VVASLQSAIPLPFGNVFALEKPVVQGVSPTCVDVGSSFTIAGTGMYPSLVTAVLIDGSPLDPRQYTVTSDTAITVIAPKISGDRLPVVVQTQQGESNDGVTIKISPRDRCN
jgi:hypothetical protein